MPGRPHHTEKMKRCVEHVMGMGHDESSAYAICTTSMQNAGEEIYAEAHAPDVVTVLESSEPRELHLLGATGQVRYEDLNGRRHLVVPVVALMEGVIHPVNAQTPEFVSAKVLEQAAASWVGKPVTLGHPKRGGTQCSAGDAAVRKEAGIGVIMRSTFNGKKLLQEAWIDEEKAKRLHPAMYENLANGGREEVSVGAFVIAEPKEAMFGDKKYKAQWLQTEGDHLAMLPGGRGACSCSDGCGTHRAAMHFVAAESIELLPAALPVLAYTALADVALDQRISAVYQAVSEKWQTTVAQTMPSAYVVQVFDDRVIVSRDGETYSVDYSVGKDGKVTLGAETQVKQQWVAAKAAMTDCPTCDGTGQTKVDGKQSDCPTCGGTGEVAYKAAAGARHSSSDMKMIQTVHDHAAALGATCDRKNLETAASVIQPKPDDVNSKIHIKRDGTRWLLLGSGDRLLGAHSNETDAKEHLERTLAKCV